MILFTDTALLFQYFNVTATIQRFRHCIDTVLEYWKGNETQFLLLVKELRIQHCISIYRQVLTRIGYIYNHRLSNKYTQTENGPHNPMLLLQLTYIIWLPMVFPVVKHPRPPQAIVIKLMKYFTFCSQALYYVIQRNGSYILQSLNILHSFQAPVCGYRVLELLLLQK